MSMRPYDGPRPKVSGRQGRYKVNLNDQIEALYPIVSGMRAVLTTEQHPQLLAMVNAVKQTAGGSRGGPFLINEHKQVLVPTSAGWFVAGTYEEIIEFELDGEIISPEPPPDLSPGDHWPGPRVGMTYTLAAGGNDIYCRVEVGNREVDVKLSEQAGVEANFLAERLAETKGTDGGRIYINEARQFFAPVGAGEAPPYLYLGPLDEEPWFPPFA